MSPDHIPTPSRMREGVGVGRTEEPTFAASALTLAGLACRALGWRPVHFWDATPAELACILAPAPGADPAPLTRGEFEQMMERERNG